MAGSIRRFKSEENNSMVAESIGEYELASKESAYEYPG